jgi:hypothetical protein
VVSYYGGYDGHAVAQAVSRRTFAAEARVRAQVSPCGILVDKVATEIGYSPSFPVFPCQYHSTVALYMRILLGDEQ